MKIIILLSTIFLIISCESNKTEFIQSKTINKLVLVKNPPTVDSLLKIQLIEFLVKNPRKSIAFYRYSSNTKYFLESKEDPGGFSSEELDNYPEDEIANFFILNCKNDSTKLVGRFHFYGLKGADDGVDQIDTLIYKCN
jgi:hypothetical protein